jgi:membrane associated rhomboid family serine protease
LCSKSIPHRVIEEGGLQVVEVTSEEHARGAVPLYTSWRSGELQIRVERVPSGIANAAHVGGLVSGALLGAILGLKSRLGNDKH